MNRNIRSALRRMHQGESGQMLAMAALMLIGFLAMTAFVIDFGRVYVAFRQLQSATDAAALAGGSGITDGTAKTIANQYSGSTSAGAVYNIPLGSGYTVVSVTFSCKTSAPVPLPPCSPANVSSGQPSANLIQVVEQVKVPMTFAAVIGTPSVTLNATATATSSGGTAAPFNVAAVVDSTASMQTSDSGGLCSGTKEHCALLGVQALLSTLSPCPFSQSSCVSSGGSQVQNAVDEVSLLTFPAVSSASVPNEYCGAGGLVSPQPYPLPAAPNYIPAANPTYKVLDFSSDYRASDTAQTLATTSNLVKGAGGAMGCAGLQDPGGQGTYYPGVIYAAENLLLAEQAARPGTQNAMIILGDGDANASKKEMDSAAGKDGTYPSYNNECQQAVTAAGWAATQGIGGTRVYTIAYNAQTSGCNTDVSPYNNPCYTMQHMASNAAYFFSDITSTRSGCTAPSTQSIASLNAIFTNIGSGLSIPRLVPDSVF